MSLTLKKLVAALVLMTLPIEALAQDSATSDAPTESGEATEESQPESDSGAATSDLSLGTPVAENGVGDVYVKETFVDWELRCIRTEDGNDPCQLYQLLRDQNNNPVSEINLFTVSGGGEAVAGANIITPLETLLTANLRLAVDGGNAKVYPFSFCRRIGCFARVGLTEAEINQFQRGVEAKILIKPAAAPDQDVLLSVSLSGFTDGWKALVAENSAAAAE